MKCFFKFFDACSNYERLTTAWSETLFFSLAAEPGTGLIAGLASASQRFEESENVFFILMA
jgi:hypothetical protein